MNRSCFYSGHTLIIFFIFNIFILFLETDYVSSGNPVSREVLATLAGPNIVADLADFFIVYATVPGYAYVKYPPETVISNNASYFLNPTIFFLFWISELMLVGHLVHTTFNCLQSICEKTTWLIPWTGSTWWSNKPSRI